MISVSICSDTVSYFQLKGGGEAGKGVLITLMEKAISCNFPLSPFSNPFFPYLLQEGMI